MRPRALRIALAVVVGSVTVASAVSLGGLSAKQLGADDAMVARCDTDGVTVGYTLGAANAVTHATISGINLACNGGQLQITLVNGAGVSQGQSAFTAVSAPAQTVPLTIGSPVAGNITAVHVVIVGP